jgi:hypothetical protein
MHFLGGRNTACVSSGSCNIELCYVMLCYVMLCYVMLCYVMLRYVMFSMNINVLISETAK